jgi:hypothetical protein
MYAFQDAYLLMATLLYFMLGWLLVNERSPGTFQNIQPNDLAGAV